jgi:ribosomal protein S18 acetylase RimI-like enzyme
MTSGPSPAFSLGSHGLEMLSRADSPAIFDLYRRCGNFFVLQDGEPPVPADADELFTDVPPSKRPEDQHVFGCRRDGRLEALAALLVDYPAPGSWYLGLLIVDPLVRGQGLGRKMYASLEASASQRGARQILAGVLRENASALRFWRSLGFERLRVVGPRTFKGRTHLIDELARQL